MPMNVGCQNACRQSWSHLIILIFWIIINRKCQNWNEISLPYIFLQKILVYSPPRGRKRVLSDSYCLSYFRICAVHDKHDNALRIITHNAMAKKLFRNDQSKSHVLFRFIQSFQFLVTDWSFTPFLWDVTIYSLQSVSLRTRLKVQLSRSGFNRRNKRKYS